MFRSSEFSAESTAKDFQYRMEYKLKQPELLSITHLALKKSNTYELEKSEWTNFPLWR
jgi:hypothetical protein